MTSALLRTPLNTLVELSLRQEHHSHLLLVPLISATLLVLGRERIFATVETQWRVGMGLVLGGTLLHAWPLDRSLSISMLSVVVIWMGGFVFCYGLRALRAGLFPWLLLFLMVPVPDPLLNQVAGWLQEGSAEVSSAMFQLMGVPVVRSGFVFALPGVTIEVAEECSGIRSSVALLIVSLLIAYLYLQSTWTRTVLVLVTLPLLIVKNSIRIVTLSLLATYVEPSVFDGSLHRQGGILFFLVALALLAPAVALLKRAERAPGTAGGPQPVFRAPSPQRGMNTTSTQ
jgi:exosortase